MEFFKKEHDLGKNGDYDMTLGDFYNDFEEIIKFDGKTGISKEQFYNIGNSIHNINNKINAHEFIR